MLCTAIAQTFLWNLSFPLTNKIAYVLEVFRKLRIESFIAFIQVIVIQLEILEIIFDSL